MYAFYSVEIIELHQRLAARGSRSGEFSLTAVADFWPSQKLFKLLWLFGNNHEIYQVVNEWIYCIKAKIMANLLQSDQKTEINLIRLQNKR